MNIRNEGLTWQTVGEELVVLDLEGSVYLKLNGTARFLWERMAEGADEPQLVQELVGAYDVDHSLATADVAAFLDDLRTRQLLKSG